MSIQSTLNLGRSDGTLCPKWFTAAAGGLLLLGSSIASAGFTFEFNNDRHRTFIYLERTLDGEVQIGNEIRTDGWALFDNYLPDTEADPIIHVEDLEYYRFSLFGAATATEAGRTVYSGEYSIFIDLRPFGFPDYGVSEGTFVFLATHMPSGQSHLKGEFYQTLGPTEEGFFDLSYGGNAMVFDAMYTETLVGTGGLIEGIIRQEAVPNVGTFALLGAAALASARRRRN